MANPKAPTHEEMRELAPELIALHTMRTGSSRESQRLLAYIAAAEQVERERDELKHQLEFFEGATLY